MKLVFGSLKGRYHTGQPIIFGFIIIVIIINRFVQLLKVVTSEALGPGSVLVSRERTESLGKEKRGMSLT